MTQRRILPGLIVVVAVLAAPCWSEPAQAPAVVLNHPIRHTAATIDVSLRAADSATVSQTLGEALGATVQLVASGTPPPAVTLELQSVSPRQALDAVARAVNGEWRPIYSVTAGTPAVGTRQPGPLGRTVTASLEQVSARAALLLIARAGGGTLELSGDLSKTLSFTAADMPVEQAMQEVTRQAGASWSATYIITAGVAPPLSPSPAPPPSRERSHVTGPALQRGPNHGVVGRIRPDGAPEGAPFDDPRFFPMPFAPRQPASPTPPSGNADSARLLAEGLARVMQMPPAQRRGAIKDFAQQLDQQFRQAQSLPAAQRSNQMMAMRPLFQAAARTYSGLTPAQRGEFQPVMDVFNRWMR